MTEQPRQPTEEELRALEAQIEEQMRTLRVEDVLVQTIVTLVNLGGRRAGLAAPSSGGEAPEADPEQLRLAIEGARALLAVIEDKLGPDAGAIRDALSQLQMAYARLAGTAGAAPATGSEPPAQEPPAPGTPGPAQASGRLWVPGQ
jgi:hypothetical protein